MSFFLNMINEFEKTSLLIIASTFTAAGAAVITTDTGKGVLLLLISAGILMLRGILKQKGYELEAAAKMKTPSTETP